MSLATRYLSQYIGSTLEVKDAATLQVYGIPTAYTNGSLTTYVPLHQLATTNTAPPSVRLANLQSHAALLEEAVRCLDQPHSHIHEVCAMLGEVGTLLWGAEARTALQGTTNKLCIAALAVRHVEAICSELCRFHEWDTVVTVRLINLCVVSATTLSTTLTAPCDPRSVDAVLGRLTQILDSSLRHLADAVAATEHTPSPSTSSSLTAPIATNARLTQYVASMGFNAVEMEVLALRDMAEAAITSSSGDSVGERQQLEKAAVCMSLCESTIGRAADNEKARALIVLAWLRCWLFRWEKGLECAEPPHSITHDKTLLQISACCRELVHCINSNSPSPSSSLLKIASGTSKIDSEKSAMREAVNAAEISLRAALTTLSTPNLPPHVLAGVSTHIACLLGIKIAAVIASAEGALATDRLATAATRLQSAQQLIFLYEKHGLHADNKTAHHRPTLRGRIHSLVASLISQYHIAHQHSKWHAYELLTIGLTHSAAAIGCNDHNMAGLIDGRLSRCELIITYVEGQFGPSSPLRIVYQDTNVGVEVLTPWGGPVFGCSTECASALGVAEATITSLHQQGGGGGGGGNANLSLQEAIHNDLEWVTRSPLSTDLVKAANGDGASINAHNRRACIRYHLVHCWHHLFANDDPVAACDPHLLIAIQLVALDGDDTKPMLKVILRFIEAAIRKLDQFALLNTNASTTTSLATTVAAFLGALAQEAASGVWMMSVIGRSDSEEGDSLVLNAMKARITSTQKAESEQQQVVPENTLLSVMGFLPCSRTDYKNLWWV